MIELNLLPDVKMEYIKAQNMRRMMFTISAIVAVVSIVLLGSLISVNQLQKKHLKDLTADITKESADLKAKPQINKILTVQNQLNSLTELHATKPAAYNLFNYLYQITPSNVSLSSLHTDFGQYTMVVTGSTETLGDVNKYVDTLKFTKFKSGDTDKSLAFGNIVLASFGLNAGTGNQSSSRPASFTINFSYDPKIFDITQKVSLIVPNKTTTRSSIDNPNDLFQAVTPAAPATTTGGN